jgi:hypothetical protein
MRGQHGPEYPQRNKRLTFLIILTSLTGYMEWGGGNSAFLFQAEYEIIAKLFTDPVSVLHPFVVIPLAGQIMLLITLFQKDPGRVLTRVGMMGLGLLIGVVLLSGLLSLNVRMVFSTVPFWIVVVMVVRNRRKAGAGRNA